jgi:hypothetical protein
VIEALLAALTGGVMMAAMLFLVRLARMESDMRRHAGLDPETERKRTTLPEVET